MKRVLHWAAMVLAAAALAVSLVPTRTLWFDPGTPIVADAKYGHAPQVAYSRTIHRRQIIEYAAVTRRVGEALPVCEGGNPPGYEYQRAEGPAPEINLMGWSGNDQRCSRLPPGQYWTSTTWEVVSPMRALLPGFLKDTVLASILPARRLTEESPAFTIYPKEEPPL